MSGLKTRFEDFRAVTDAEKVRRETQAKLEAVEQRIAYLSQSLEGSGEPAAGLAEKFLAGQDLSALRVDAGAIVAELHNLRAEQQILAAATKLADGRVAEAKRAAVQSMVPAARKEYGAACTNLAKVLIELRAAISAETAFRDLHSTGEAKLFPTYLTPAPISFDSQMPRYWFRETIEAGLIDPSLLAQFDEV